MRLTEINYHLQVEIKALRGDPQIVERLRELGFFIGRPIMVIGRGPLKGPLIIRAGSQIIALRTEEAECLEV